MTTLGYWNCGGGYIGRIYDHHIITAELAMGDMYPVEHGRCDQMTQRKLLRDPAWRERFAVSEDRPAMARAYLEEQRDAMDIADGKPRGWHRIIPRPAVSSSLETKARRADIASRYGLTGGESVFVDMLAYIAARSGLAPTRGDFMGYDEMRFAPIVRAEIDHRAGAR